MIFNDFGAHLGTLSPLLGPKGAHWGDPLAPLGAPFAPLLERIRGLWSPRVSGGPLGWILERFLMVLGAIFDSFGSYF